LNKPKDVTLDSQGNIYVADTYNNHIVEFNSAGGFSQYIGDGLLGKPQGDAFDSGGNLYVADSSNNRVTRFRPATAVPEPGAFALLAAGLAGAAASLRRRRK